jgi:cysteine desulfurase / selenocysteine lyase
VLSFSVEGIHPHDLGSFLDSLGIAVRVGHHCAMPLMAHFKVPALTRLSLGCYTTLKDIQLCVDAVREARVFFQCDAV